MHSGSSTLVTPLRTRKIGGITDPMPTDQPYFAYRLHYTDGSDAGQAEYAVRIEPGEIIWTADGRQLRVVSLIEAEESSPYAGLLMVEPV